jgi:8-oxo-dGTP pyrophosphatase MutT (NUDIX family)
MKAEPWTVLSSEQLLDCRIFSVERTLSQSPLDASVHEFFRLQSADFAQIVPVTERNEVVMVRQFRHGSGELSLEIPAGLVDEGETPAEAAARECLEETGYAVDGVQPFGVLRPNPALFVNYLHAFVAYGARQVAEIAQTATEHTEVELIPVDRITDLLLQGVIDHALDTAILWRFLHERS